MLLATGGVRCWGANWSGQLGDGTTEGRFTPPATDVLGDVQSIATGKSHTCALLKTGGVRCWGSNDYRRSTPPVSDALTGVQAVAGGYGYTCALMTTGAVRCWGSNTDGQLGDGNTGFRVSPVQVVGTCRNAAPG